MPNVSRAIPEIEIEFGGEQKRFVFSTLAFCLLEEVTGKNALDGEMWEKPNVTLLTTMIWAALQEPKPGGGYIGPTLDEVRMKISHAGLLELYANIGEAFSRSSPGADVQKKSET